MLTKLLFGAAVAAAISNPAMAQTMTLSKGQMMKVSPSGQITITGMPTDTKMMRAMHRRGHSMSGGFAVWMDERGKIYMSDSAIFIQDLRQKESN